MAQDILQHMSAVTLRMAMEPGLNIMAGTVTSSTSIMGGGKAGTGGTDITRDGSAGGGSWAPIGIGTLRRSTPIRTPFFRPAKRPAPGTGAMPTSNIIPMSAHAPRDGERYRRNRLLLRRRVACRLCL
jgi:hypothetical protein